MNNKPEVTHCGFLDCQVCVPASYTDEEVIAFANSANPAGTQLGWVIRKEGDPALNGDAERVQCRDPSRADCVHIMLDC